VSSSYGTNSLTTLRATEIFVLMHSGIVNGHQLLCDAHTVVEPHRGTAAFFFFTHYRPFPLDLFMCLSLRQSFSWVPLNNLKSVRAYCSMTWDHRQDNNVKRAADLSLVMP